MPSSPRALALAALFVLTSFVGCDCNKTPLVMKDQCKAVTGVQADHFDPCATSAECGDHFACKATKGNETLQCCVFLDRTCSTEADCCPGQTCSADRKKCFDKFLNCKTDADCGEAGDRFCEVYTDVYGTSSRCRFHECDSLGQCPDGQACFNGECIAEAAQATELPCGGTCESGKACVPTIDRCQDYSSPTGRAEAACPMTCNAGFLATFQDARNLWDSCQLPPVRCVCEELPGLHSNDLGRFSAITVNPDDALYVSEYDGQYGDLVVVKYGLDGAKQATEYVDGVPAGNATFGPSGARGGVQDPGDDVGRYTDITSGNGRVYVSYYDVTSGDLKLATRGTDGHWASHRVDGANADLGLYTSVALDPAGKPGISYFQRGGEAGFDASACPTAPTGALKFVTALKFAHAKTATPTSASDWDVTTIDCFDRPPPTCDACAATPANGICASTDAGTSCLNAGTGCTGCSSTQACVSVNGGNVCADKVTPPNLQELTPGVGLFSSLAFKDDTAVVAYMKRSGSPAKGALYGTTITSANSVGPRVLLDGNGDTGFFPDLKIDPSSKSIAIAYQDFTSKALKFYYSANLQTGVTPEIIDSGNDLAAPGNQSWVGSDSALVFGTGGVVYAIYQDATKGDLKLARRTNAWQVQASPHTEGAVGFFADGVLVGNTLFASHARVHAKLVKMAPVIDNSLLLDSITAN